MQSLRMQSLDCTYNGRHLGLIQSFSQVLINQTPPLQSSQINQSFQSGRPNTLFKRQSIVRCHSQIESVTVAVRRLRSAAKDSTMADRPTLGLTRKSVYGQQNVRNTTNQRLGASARASPFNPPYRSIAAHLDAHKLVNQNDLSYRHRYGALHRVSHGVIHRVYGYGAYRCRALIGQQYGSLTGRLYTRSLDQTTDA